MSYTPTTDFLALLRQSSSGAALSRMPGLDYIIAALARGGIINVVTGQTAPTTNQPNTAWFKPAQPSWSAEGVLYLWDATSGAYVPATPLLWTAFASGGAGGYSFQSASALTNIVNAGTTLVAIQRASPIATTVVLPSLLSQWKTGRKLQIVDFSTGVIQHSIAVTPSDTSTIMQRSSLTLRSTQDQLSGVMLQPSPDLNSWVIAP